MKKVASIFSLFCGVAIPIVWAILLGTGNITEFQTSPFQAVLLLAAEPLTATLLIFGGIGLLTRKHWGLRTDLAALGMLLYCAVFSIGVFGQAGNNPAASFFGVIALLTAIFSAGFILESVKGGTQSKQIPFCPLGLFGSSELLRRSSYTGWEKMAPGGVGLCSFKQTVRIFIRTVAQAGSLRKISNIYLHVQHNILTPLAAQQSVAIQTPC